MGLKIFKILFIFSLISTLVSCEAADYDLVMGDKIDPELGTDTESINGFVIQQSAWVLETPQPSDTVARASDTLAKFPTQQEFTQMSVEYVFSLQRLASEMVQNLRQMVANNDGYAWMNYYSPYLGAFVSSNDSRVKQWLLENDAMYEDIKWPYHLVISDLPDGNMDGRASKALEIFYDDDFMNGVMLFAPSRVNPVRFPEKLLGHGAMGKLYFSRSNGEQENTLYVSGFNTGTSPESMGNVFLYTKLSNNLISFASIADIPGLWFDTKENSGYSVLMFGGLDCANDNMAVHTAFTPNTNSSNISSTLVNKENVSLKMNEYNRTWNQMMYPGEQDSVLEVYDTPAFLTNMVYVGAGRVVSDRNLFSKALSKADEVSLQQFDISPLKVSIMQLEW